MVFKQRPYWGGASGYRSAIAASLVCRTGQHEVADLVGGLAGWEAAHLAARPVGRS